ncbi:MULTISPECIES: hypothetical protein [unclassified Oerskovia]|jgi:hypothetical protein|uniref:hypothetical protein n=1 Tax=unclassified Oerskovia TaxID=2619021 RepID=UPI0006FECF27|nr:MULTISPECIES: hypothetical protein [unclassified Oerskovia]KRC33109.1 hypothetical protein ASE15_15765 [Oerskovia sp. Root22]
MKRKIMAVLTATVVAFGGVVVAGAPAQAATGPYGCIFQNNGYPTFTETFTGTCGMSRARFTGKTATGAPVDDVAYWSNGYSVTSTYPSWMRTQNYGQAIFRGATSAWKVST